MLSDSEGGIDAVLEFTAPEDVVVARLLSRGRADDTEQVIRHRQQVYRSQTAPLLAHYAARLLTFHAVGSAEQIGERVLTALKERGLRGLAVSGQASDRLFHAAIRNFSYSAWTSRGGR